MNTISGKIWGTSRVIAQTPWFELHRCTVHPHARCSKHKHTYKYNGFFCEAGEVIIRVWKNDYGLCDKTILKPGDYTIVMPNEFHEFEATINSVLFETYWPATFSPADIYRLNCGSICNPADAEPTQLDMFTNKLIHEDLFK